MELFTLTDLVSFGEHLLSDKRKKTVRSHPEKDDLSERLKVVSDADIANWKDLKAKK